MAIETPTWTYKSKGDKQTASEMNELAQAVITNAIELSNTKDDIANLSDDITNFDNRITSIEESETVKKEERNQPNGYAGLDSSGKVPIERIYGATATVTDVEAYELLPATGSNGVIYNVLNTGSQYKWSGSAYVDITDGIDKAKKNETSIFDCSNGTSTKYYSSLSDAINAVPLVYRTSNRIISYLSAEYPQVELIVNKDATVDGSISIYLDGVLRSTISVSAGMTAIQIADKLSDLTYVDYAPWSWTDSGSANKFTLTYGKDNISKKVTSYYYTANSAEKPGLISFNILKEGFATTAVNHQYYGIDDTTWTNLTKWVRIPNQTDLADIRSNLNELETNKLDKTSLSSLIDSDSETNAATSRAVKLVNDKIEQVKDGGLEDGSIELPKLSPTLAAYIGSGGEVTNQADDDDLENTIINGVPVIREKTTKTYNPENYSGMGRVILRKNMVNGVNVLTQEMINQANIVYEIRYDFDLDSSQIVVPFNCCILFSGGSFKNGTIVGTDTLIYESNCNILNDALLSGSFINKHFNPRWWGAVSYDFSVLSGIYNSTSENLIYSDVSFNRMVSSMYSTNTNNIYLDALYALSDELAIASGTYFPKVGVNISGNGLNTGFISQISNANKNVLSINANVETISFNVHLSNFSIYVGNTNRNTVLSSAIYLNECIRSNAVDVHISGGFSSFNKGLFHLHSVVNNNIFLNIFNRCKGFDTLSGGGIHYSQITYMPTLQEITNCAFQQLGGAGIECEMGDTTYGGFGGAIIGNELEGNSKGAIALSGVSTLVVKGNFFEVKNTNGMSNFFPNLPICPWTFGVVSSDESGFRCYTNGLDFSVNQTGIGGGSVIDYSIIFSGSLSGAISRAVNINCNVLNHTNNTKYISLLGYCENINISNNKFTAYDVSLFEDTDFPFYIGKGIDSVFYNYKSINISYGTFFKSKNKQGVLNFKNVQKASNYPYAIPISTSDIKIFKDGDFALDSLDKIIYVCTSSGRLHYNTLASFVSGSNQISCSQSAWDWRVGDVVKSVYIETGQATITGISGNIFTLSNNANTTTSDWITDALLLPLELKNSIAQYGISSKRPTYSKDGINIGHKYYDTQINKLISYNGSIWLEYDGEIAGISRKGTYSNRPLSTSTVPPTNIGFQYYNTNTHKYMTWESGDKYYYADGTEALA